MEPMTLGSPTQSPTNPLSSMYLGSPLSPGVSHSSQHHHNNSGYLPGYLMGESNPLSPGSPLVARQPLISPNKLNRSLSTMSSSTVGMPSAPQTPVPLGPTRGPALLKENSNLNRSHARAGAEKPGGPPTNSLMYSINHTPNNSTINSGYGGGTPGSSSRLANSSRLLETPSASCQQEVGGIGDPLSVWVTVFGFPPAGASFILSQLSSCGTVLQHVLPPNANWMHVRFQTRLQARKAISKNGSVIGGNIMVGISPCKDEGVLENVNQSSASILENSISNTSVANISTGLGTPRSIRPLTQAFKEAQPENKVVPGTNTPNKDNGIVSKAMEYIFGW